MKMQTAAKPLFQYSQTIGAQALGPKGLNSPVAVARGPGRLLYVLNRPSESSPRGNWIAKCTIDDEYLGTFGAYGTEEGEFTWPNGLAVDHLEAAGNPTILWKASVFLTRMETWSTVGLQRRGMVHAS